MAKDQNVSKSAPKYALVFWVDTNDWSIVLTSDVSNKRMLYDRKILDLILYKEGEEPAGGYTKHMGVVLELSCMYYFKMNLTRTLIYLYLSFSQHLFT